MKPAITIYGNHKNGKSTLINRLQGIPFDEKYTPTSGVDYKIIDMDELCLRMWDCSGEGRYFPIFSKFFNEVSLGILTIDLSNAEDMEFAIDAIVILQQQQPNIPLILVSTKSELANTLSTEQLFNLRTEFNVIDIVQTSSKTNEGIDQLKTSIRKEIEAQLHKERIKKTLLGKIKTQLSETEPLFLALTHLEDTIKDLHLYTQYQFAEEVTCFINTIKNMNTSSKLEEITNNFITKCMHISTAEASRYISTRSQKQMKKTFHAISLALLIVVLCTGTALLLGGVLGLAIFGVAIATIIMAKYISIAVAALLVPPALYYVYREINKPTQVDMAVKKIADVSVQNKKNSQGFFQSPPTEPDTIEEKPINSTSVERCGL